MTDCSRCINDINEMKYTGLYLCKIGLKVETDLNGTFPIDDECKEIEDCKEYRTTSIEEAILNLSGGNDELKKAWKTLSERDDIDCPALKDPYKFEGCWESLAVCCNFDECEKIFEKAVNTGERL